MSRTGKIFLSVMIFVFVAGVAYAETDKLKLTEWRPKSQMVVKETKILLPNHNLKKILIDFPKIFIRFVRFK